MWRQNPLIMGEFPSLFIHHWPKDCITVVSVIVLDVHFGVFAFQLFILWMGVLTPCLSGNLMCAWRMSDHLGLELKMVMAAM